MDIRGHPWTKMRILQGFRDGGTNVWFLPAKGIGALWLERMAVVLRWWMAPERHAAVFGRPRRAATIFSVFTHEILRRGVGLLQGYP